MWKWFKALFTKGTNKIFIDAFMEPSEIKEYYRGRK